MLLGIVFAGLCLATALEASPVKQEDSLDRIIRFKRDAVLSARDLELADMHGVNLTEMWKHSVVKRDDGDDVTIWVNNHYQDVEGPVNDLSKRQSARLWPGSHYRDFSGARNCRSPQRTDITSDTSPYTGGIIAMRDWAVNHRGFFLIGRNSENNWEVWGPGSYNEGGWGWRTIMIGGSNSGRNARYRMAVWDMNIYYFNWVGTDDIIDDLNWTHDRRREYSGRWRAAAHGRQYCGQPGGRGVGQEWQVISFDERV